MRCNHVLNESVRNAFNAWQMGDKKLFLSFFQKDALLINDVGSKLSLKNFVRSSCGKERFISIGKVKKGGKEFTGTLYSEKWGELDIYFSFVVNDTGMLTCLQVGLASERFLI